VIDGIEKGQKCFDRIHNVRPLKRPLQMPAYQA
jgi:hypothetical protein